MCIRDSICTGPISCTRISRSSAFQTRCSAGSSSSSTRSCPYASAASVQMCIRDSFYTSPSRCAVADSCSISIDRRMTAGETYQSCLKEIEDLPACKKYAKDVKVSMYMYDLSLIHI